MGWVMELVTRQKAIVLDVLRAALQARQDEEDVLHDGVATKSRIDKMTARRYAEALVNEGKAIKLSFDNPHARPGDEESGVPMDVPVLALPEITADGPEVAELKRQVESSSGRIDREHELRNMAAEMATPLNAPFRKPKARTHQHPTPHRTTKTAMHASRARPPSAALLSRANGLRGSVVALNLTPL